MSVFEVSVAVDVAINVVIGGLGLDIFGLRAPHPYGNDIPEGADAFVCPPCLRVVAAFPVNVSTPVLEDQLRLDERLPQFLFDGGQRRLVIGMPLEAIIAVAEVCDLQGYTSGMVSRGVEDALGPVLGILDACLSKFAGDIKLAVDGGIVLAEL